MEVITDIGKALYEAEGVEQGKILQSALQHHSMEQLIFMKQEYRKKVEGNKEK